MRCVLYCFYLFCSVLFHICMACISALFSFTVLNEIKKLNPSQTLPCFSLDQGLLHRMFLFFEHHTASSRQPTWGWSDPSLYLDCQQASFLPMVLLFWATAILRLSLPLWLYIVDGSSLPCSFDAQETDASRQESGSKTLASDFYW